ncbi:transporter substrate-binding domain-containing protein [Oscillibacter valericigenes]|uniref:transporter substrate-binding domain-containing protein n=1 Tax=Oscillibacter valericigenes TaxID=351091 RepID=UPI001F3DAD70|nr:transporter substrate-binding domain-containing protein [Oscillibacter valericigenes]MCF2617011.1 transporter substrate-binding domain-containing protein [Oscillibacter valericigenes]
MKKFLALLMTMAMVLSLAACGGSKEEAPAQTNEPAAAEEPAEPAITTVTEGKLTVATSPDFAPYEFYAIDESGNAQLAGFDMALAQYIADYLGLELEVVPMDFDGVLAEVTAGNVDLGMAGLSPDPDRMEAMDFSDIYYQGGQSLVVVQENKDKWASLEELNDPSLTIGAQLGSIQYDLAEENTPDADIVQLAKVTDVVSELLGGKLDAGYIETVVAESYAKNYPDLYIAFDVPYEVEGSAVGVVKGNEALLAGVNEAIAAALADGSMDDFVAQANEQASGEIFEGLVD